MNPAKQRFDDIEVRVAQFDKILSTRIETSAKVKLEQERLTALQMERTKLQQDYDDLQQKLSLARSTAKDANATVAEVEAKKDQLERDAESLRNELQTYRSKRLTRFQVSHDDPSHGNHG